MTIKNIRKTMKKILFAVALAGAAMLTACGGKTSTGVTMGSLSSDFDSLSYALGANVGYGMGYEMKDIPLDYKSLDKGIEEGALDKVKVDREKTMELLREFFMTKRGQRAQQIAAKRAEQDSIRLASGDETKVEYPAADPAMFETEEERKEISYALGSDFGYNIGQSGFPIQLVWFAKAMQDVRDNSAKMTEDEVNQYLQYYFMVKRPAEYAEASEAWLKKIEKKSGVKKTESGLLYKVVKAGDPEVMAKDPRDVVKVHYTGRNMAGKVFDTSKFANRSDEQKEMMRKQFPDEFDEKGNPKDEKEAEFPLNRVIKGWTEGMQLVGKGGKIILWIPADMAYGARGSGRDIGPNEALEFEVELIDVIPHEEPAPAPAAEETTEE
jgi:FKBP-type peptidyl-prolyl cis-trans isomerases 1